MKIILLFLFYSAFPAFAQQVSLRDAETKESIPFATVLLLKGEKIVLAPIVMRRGQ